MRETYAEQAVQAVLEGKAAYCKFLSANDSGATGGHQSGILISKSARDMLFYPGVEKEPIKKRAVEIYWQDSFKTESCFTYYQSKNELRITRFGRNFPFLQPDSTGDLFVLVERSKDQYQGFFLKTDDEINQFLDAFGMSSTETNCLIDIKRMAPEKREEKEIRTFIAQLKEEFPSSEVMSGEARKIQNFVYNHLEYMETDPDKKLIEWTRMEYTLFRALENARYGGKIAQGFSSVDEFISVANKVLNRRKSRAGKSLEHHLAALFDANHLKYSAQAITEGHKKPDFLFPSEHAYHDPCFPERKLITLAAKTTCKDRWRQVLNEADRLRNGIKYLCTLQQGISPAQLNEMQSEKVILVVPAPYIKMYPAEKRSDIWTIKKFISFVKEIEQS